MGIGRKFGQLGEMWVLRGYVADQDRSMAWKTIGRPVSLFCLFGFVTHLAWTNARWHCVLQFLLGVSGYSYSSESVGIFLLLAVATSGSTCEY